MGLIKLFSDDEPNPNPDPTNYTIRSSKTIGRFLLVLVYYPNCTNYSGEKILVYENVSLEQLKAQKHIDPHFLEDSRYYSPIARFVPNKHGWNLAENFCKGAS